MDERSTPERVLDSAIELLRTQGAAALTVRNVAEGAGCSTTGVYTHFGGKDGLIDAIFVEGFESFDVALDRAGDDLVSLCAAYRQWALTHPTHYQVMFAAAVPGFRPSEDALERAGKSYDRLAARVENRSELAGSEARAAAFHLWATAHGYVMLELLGMYPPDLGSVDELWAAGIREMLNVVA